MLRKGLYVHNTSLENNEQSDITAKEDATVEKREQKRLSPRGWMILLGIVVIFLALLWVGFQMIRGGSIEGRIIYLETSSNRSFDRTKECTL